MKYLKTACVLLAVCLFSPASAQDAPPPKKLGDGKPIRALLVLGGCCHDYANQQNLLAQGIAARARVDVTVGYDPDKGTRHLNPVYGKPARASGYDVVIHDECSADVKDPVAIENILKSHREGVPGVVLHCGTHSYRSQGWPRAVTPWFEFTGLQTTGHGRSAPIDITYVDRESPITKGLADWTTVSEELYNNSEGKVLDTAKALARGKQGKDEAVVTWTNLYRGKTKVLATTLGHNNETIADARYLDLVTRGLLWSVDKLDEQHLKAAPRGAPATEAAANPAGALTKAVAENALHVGDLHATELRLPGRGRAN